MKEPQTKRSCKRFIVQLKLFATTSITRFVDKLKTLRDILIRINIFEPRLTKWTTQQSVTKYPECLVVNHHLERRQRRLSPYIVSVA